MPQLTITVPFLWKVAAESAVHSGLHHANTFQSSWHLCCWQGTRLFVCCVRVLIGYTPSYYCPFLNSSIVALLSGTFNCLFCPHFCSSLLALIPQVLALGFWPLKLPSAISYGTWIAASRWKARKLIRKIKEDLNKRREIPIEVWRTRSIWCLFSLY